MAVVIVAVRVAMDVVGLVHQIVLVIVQILVK